MCNVRTGPETKKNKKRMEGVLKRNGEKIFAQLELRFKMLLHYYLLLVGLQNLLTRSTKDRETLGITLDHFAIIEIKI